MKRGHMIDLPAIRALIAAATPGPWAWDISDRLNGPPRTVDYGLGPEEHHDQVIETDSGYYPPREHDREFIAAARTALPEALDEIEQLRAEVLIHETNAVHIQDLLARREHDTAERIAAWLWGQSTRTDPTEGYAEGIRSGAWRRP